MMKFIKRTAVCLMFAPTVVMAEYPVANQDHYTLQGGARLEVLNNDTGEGLRVVELNEWTVKGGKTRFDSSDRNSARRRVEYIAPENFVGEDEFWYVMADEQGRRNAAKVTVTVKPNDSYSLYPQIDEISVQKNTPIRIDVLKNDGVLIAAGSMNTGQIIAFNDWSKNGGRVVRADIDEKTQQLQYTPKQDFVGEDEFWYVMKTGPQDVEHANKVVIKVAENYASGPYPTATPDNFRVKSVNRGRTVPAYYPLDNDIGSNLKIVDRKGYSQKGGTYSVNSAGQLSYSPPGSLQNKPEPQEDKIWYVIEDELGRRNWSVINFTIPAFFRS